MSEILNRRNKTLPAVIYMVMEDALSSCIAKKILYKYKKKGYELHSIRAQGGRTYILKRLLNYNKSAKGILFFVIVDLDKEQCVVDFVRHCFKNTPKSQNLIFRVAVREVESWILADKKGFCRYFKIEEKRLQIEPEKLTDPKEFLVNIIQKYCPNRSYKQSIVPEKNSTAIVGPLYNPALIQFVNREWNMERARQFSPSLERCILALSHL